LGVANLKAAPPGEQAASDTFSRAMVEQVSGGTIELFRNGGGRVRLSINPPELGGIDLDLIVDRNGVKLILTSESGEVRNVMQANMDQLRSSLHDQGMNRFDIQIQDRLQDRPGMDSGGWTPDGNSGRDSMQSNSSGQFRPGNGEGGASALARGTGDNREAAIGAGRENSNGELSVFA